MGGRKRTLETMSPLLETSLSICALCWSVAALCFGYAQFKDAQAWDAPDDDDEDERDPADYWKPRK